MRFRNCSCFFLLTSEFGNKMIKIVGFFTAIFVFLGVLLYCWDFPFDSSSVEKENYFSAQTAQLTDNMLLMEYEMVNDDQVDVRKQLKETALFTSALLKKVPLRFS